MKRQALTKKDLAILANLLGKNVHHILSALSSLYCEQQEDEFKEAYGCTFAQAKNAFAKFIYLIND